MSAKSKDTNNDEWWQRKTELWNRKIEIRRQLIKDFKGLRELYWSIGYSQEIEVFAEELLLDLCTEISPRISDVGELKRRIYAVRSENQMPIDSELPEEYPRLLKENAFLISEHRIVENLENIEGMSDSEIAAMIAQRDRYDVGSLRTLNLPVESVVADGAKCIRALNKLGVFLEQVLPPNFAEPGSIADLLELIEFLKSEIRLGSASSRLLEGLQLLESNVKGAVDGHSVNGSKKEELDEMLLDVSDAIQCRQLGAVAESTRSLLKAVGLYLQSPWMRKRDVTVFLLDNGLNSEIDRASKPLNEWWDLCLVGVLTAATYWSGGPLFSGVFLTVAAGAVVFRRFRSWRWFRVLQFSATEVRTGSFDAEETARRLRGLDRSGYSVATILFALLRVTEEGKTPAG